MRRGNARAKGEQEGKRAQQAGVERAREGEERELAQGGKEQERAQGARRGLCARREKECAREGGGEERDCAREGQVEGVREKRE